VREPGMMQEKMETREKMRAWAKLKRGEKMKM
jgi:hypothetical protein